MVVISTSFTVPCSIDRAALAIQDTIDQFGWPVLEVSTSLIVAQGPGINFSQFYNFPIVSSKLAEEGDQTKIDVSVTVVGPMLGFKKHLTGIMGRFTNSVSLRVQTESIAINPTVALGQGQGTDSSSQVPAAGQTRAQQLKDLKELLDAGVLSDEEFAAEKARVLNSEEVSGHAPSEPEIDPRVELIEALELTLQKFHLPASEPPTLANTHIGVPAHNGRREGWYGHLIDSAGLNWWTGTAWATDWDWVTVFQGVPADNGHKEGWYADLDGSGSRWWDGDHWSESPIEPPTADTGAPSPLALMNEVLGRSPFAPSVSDSDNADEAAAEDPPPVGPSAIGVNGPLEADSQ